MVQNPKFPAAKKFCAYVGLVPSTKLSSTYIYHGKITKQGNSWLRWITIEAAQLAIRKDGYLQSFYQRIFKRRGKQKAKVAVARKIPTAAYHILMKKQAYREPKGKLEILSGKSR